MRAFGIDLATSAPSTRSMCGRATRGWCSTTRRARAPRLDHRRLVRLLAHLLWVGERTRQLDGARREFFAGVHNPIGVKVGPSATPEEVVALCERLNPHRVPGRLTFIIRLEPIASRICCRRSCARCGNGHPGRLGVRSDARERLRAPRPASRRAASTRLGRGRRVLRRLTMRSAVAGRCPSRVHRRGRHRVPGRLSGRARGRADDALREASRDPRLNARQSLDLAFRVAELMRR